MVKLVLKEDGRVAVRIQKMNRSKIDTYRIVPN